MTDDDVRALLIRIDERVAALLERSDDQEMRLRTVERKQWRIGGVAAAAGVALTYLGRKVGLLG